MNCAFIAGVSQDVITINDYGNDPTSTPTSHSYKFASDQTKFSEVYLPLPTNSIVEILANKDMYVSDLSIVPISLAKFDPRPFISNGAIDYYNPEINEAKENQIAAISNRTSYIDSVVKWNYKNGWFRFLKLTTNNDTAYSFIVKIFNYHFKHVPIPQTFVIGVSHLTLNVNEVLMYSNTSGFIGGFRLTQSDSCYYLEFLYVTNNTTEGNRLGISIDSLYINDQSLELMAPTFSEASPIYTFWLGKTSGTSSDRPTWLHPTAVGYRYYDETLGKPIFSKAAGTPQWVEEDGATAGVLRSGTFANKPASADIYVGFRYFCTDKQTTEGATNGIEIIYKGNGVWVDALGRVVS